jgi:Ca-activated chloride channel family protein
VAHLSLTYRDLLQKTDGKCAGDLALEVKGDGSEQRELDPFVAARLARSRTAQTLTEANKLFEQGRFAEATTIIDRNRAELDKAEVAARRAAPLAKPKTAGRGLAADFEEQTRALATAKQQAAEAPPPTAAPNKAAVKENNQRAMDMSF